VTSSTYTRTWLVDTTERVLRTFVLLCVGAKGAGEPGTASFADAVKANTKGTVA
jgi:hypothetical protein